MRLFVLYDRDGTIRSAMKVEVMGEGLDHPYGLLEEGEAVLEAKVTGELGKPSPSEICERFAVDPQKFLLMEQSFHEALKEMRGARNNIEKQMDLVRDEMAALTATLVFALTSVQYAEVMLFAEAGGKINGRLLAAAEQYQIAENSAQEHRGMARALAKHHEMRLRQLGTSGVFGSIPTDKIRSTDLDKFTFRR